MDLVIIILLMAMVTTIGDTHRMPTADFITHTTPIGDTHPMDMVTAFLCSMV
jgi:hypothetical protein